MGKTMLMVAIFWAMLFTYSGNAADGESIVKTPILAVENCGCQDKDAAEKDKQDASEEKRE